MQHREVVGIEVPASLDMVEVAREKRERYLTCPSTPDFCNNGSDDFLQTKSAVPRTILSRMKHAPDRFFR
jgi:hypothetical protein